LVEDGAGFGTSTGSRWSIA